MELKAAKTKIAQFVWCYHLHTYSTRQSSKAHHSHRITLKQPSMLQAMRFNTCTMKYLKPGTCKSFKPPRSSRLELLSTLELLPCRTHAGMAVPLSSGSSACFGTWRAPCPDPLWCVWLHLGAGWCDPVPVAQWSAFASSQGSPLLGHIDASWPAWTELTGAAVSLMRV